MTIYTVYASVMVNASIGNDGTFFSTGDEPS